MTKTRKTTSQEKIDEIQALRATGLTIKEVAERAGVHRSVARYRSPPYQAQGRQVTYEKYYAKNRDKIIARVKKNYYKKRHQNTFIPWEKRHPWIQKKSSSTT